MYILADIRHYVNLGKNFIKKILLNGYFDLPETIRGKNRPVFALFCG